MATLEAEHWHAAATPLIETSSVQPAVEATESAGDKLLALHMAIGDAALKKELADNFLAGQKLIIEIGDCAYLLRFSLFNELLNRFSIEREPADPDLPEDSPELYLQTVKTHLYRLVVAKRRPTPEETVDGVKISKFEVRNKAKRLRILNEFRQFIEEADPDEYDL
jgi:hypothetical protein